MSAPAPILTVSHLSASIAGQQVVEDVSFEVPATGITAVLGRNGVGKTSSIRGILGLIHRQGEVTLAGERIDGLPTHRIVQRGVGYVPEDREVFAGLTVAENLALAERGSRLRGEANPRRAFVAELFPDLVARRAQQAGTLSGGQQQMVSIGRALLTRPKVLLLDEPLAALDLRLRKDMQIELKRIQQTTGITFIYVTHDQEEALSMSDTVVVMDKGRIQQIGRPEDIYNEPKNAFVADFIGESNILDGVMLEDFKVRFFGRVFECVDKGFAPNEPVDVVIRPEDIDIVKPAESHLVGTVTGITFKGLNYDIIVEFKGFKWLIQTTDYHGVGETIGIRLNPEDIHIMHKSEYSGLFGDYSSYSAEYDELTEDAEDEEE